MLSSSSPVLFLIFWQRWPLMPWRIPLNGFCNFFEESNFYKHGSQSSQFRKVVLLAVYFFQTWFELFENIIKRFCLRLSLKFRIYSESYFPASVSSENYKIFKLYGHWILHKYPVSLHAFSFISNCFISKSVLNKTKT